MAGILSNFIRCTMQKFLKFLQDNIFNAFIIFIVFLTVIPILAPLFQALGIEFLANAIYATFKFSCHQFHWRSVHFFDYQVAWCTRDMFIWIGFLGVALAVKFKFIKKSLAWYWIVPFTIPLALDGGVQTIATIIGFGSNEQFYLATNLTRMITGSIFGMGLGIVIAGFLQEEEMLSRQDNLIKPNENKHIKQNYLTLFGQLTLIFLSMLILYIILVWIWKISSPNYPPSGLFDDITRKAPQVQTWQMHRGDHSQKNWFVEQDNE